VLAGLNDALRAAELGTFVTAVYGELHAGSARFDLAVAGHPLPVLVGADGHPRFVGHHGTVLGPLAELRLSVEEVRLAPGCTLVLYTDGLTDVRPPHGLDEEATLALIADAVREARTAEEIADRMHARISARLAITERADDIAVLVVRVVCPPGGPGDGPPGPPGQELRATASRIMAANVPPVK
jgi:serine phosphatase RsbU (regulator of sigma subunit)